jgi:hypothetical protein
MWSAMPLSASGVASGPYVSAATFRTLRDALKFALEDSDPHTRNRIQTVTADGDFLALADIKRKYDALRPKRCPITTFL